MRVYADTNFFTNLFLRLSHGVDAHRLYEEHVADGGDLIPVTPLLHLEFVNAVERVVFDSRHGGQWRITPENALLAAAAFDDAMEARETFELSSLSLAAVKVPFELLAHRHTAEWGFRTYDILHVASALALGCDAFWTFDAKAKKLAALEGLATN